MFFQCWKIGYVVDWEQIMGYQYGCWGGVDGGYNVFREMKLVDGFYQQCVVVEVFCVFDIVWEDDDIEIIIGYFDQWCICQQFDVV